MINTSTFWPAICFDTMNNEIPSIMVQVVYNKLKILMVPSCLITCICTIYKVRGKVFKECCYM